MVEETTCPDELAALLDVFRSACCEFGKHNPDPKGLVCRFGMLGRCAVIKLQKQSWTNDTMKGMGNTSGIFFSIWQCAEEAHDKKVHYNIHALKLRELSGYSITSRSYAEEFRSTFAPHASEWPNVSVAFGPLTLMQGWMTIDSHDAEQEILGLLRKFSPLCGDIDRLLQTRSLGRKARRIFCRQRAQ